MSDYIVIHGIRIAKDFVPETFGRLTTIGPRFVMPAGNKTGRAPHQVCQCDCGEIKTILCSRLNRGGAKSCGCEQRRRASEVNRKHGMCDSTEYKSWENMIQRCMNIHNKAYHNYGGRGITVCDRWSDSANGFTNFLFDMGMKPTKQHEIDRKNPNGNYCPENCRWVTEKDQSRNRRNNRILTYGGQSQCISDWALQLSIPLGTLRKRLKMGWSVERALSTPRIANRNKGT